MSHAVATREVPAQLQVSISRPVYLDQVGDFVAEAVALLTAHLAAAGVEPTGFERTFFHTIIGDNLAGMVEVALPVGEVVAPAGEVAVRIDPAHREALTTVVKRQVNGPEIMGAYEAVELWLRRHGFERSVVPARQIALAPYREIDDDDVALEIIYPIQRPGEGPPGPG